MRERLFATACIVAALHSSPAGAQTPAGNELVAHSERLGSQELPFFACDSESNCVEAVSYALPVETGVWQRRVARPISPSGRVLPEVVLHTNEGALTTWAVGLRTGFSVLWLRNYPRGSSGSNAEYEVLVAQRYDPHMRPVGPEIEFPRVLADSTPRLLSPLSIVKVPDGYGVLYSGFDRPERSDDCWDCEYGLFLLLFSDSGTLTHGPTSVSSDTLGYERGFYNGMAVDEDGNLIIVFNEKSQNLELFPAEVRMARFSASGERLGEETTVNAPGEDEQYGPSVAAANDGSALVVWQDNVGGLNHAQIRGRRLRPDGSFDDAPFLVNQPTALAQWTPNVAAGASGDFFVSWMGFRADEFWTPKSRLIPRNHAALHSEVPLSPSPWALASVPQLGVAPDGAVLAGWPFWTFDDSLLIDAHFRRFVFAKGAEICAVRASFWNCSFGPAHSKAFRIKLPQSGNAVALLGDIDGDGRDDPCTFARGTLRCDLDHGGKAFERTARFQAAPGGSVFLADVEGQGHDDLCIWKAGDLRCANALAGGSFGPPIHYGNANDRAAVGDVDGDGRDDVCAVRRGVFRCDTAHDGGSGEITRFLGEIGDPFLADLDGDGVDDPCVAQPATIVCAVGPKAVKERIAIPANSDVVVGLVDGL